LPFGGVQLSGIGKKIRALFLSKSGSFSQFGFTTNQNTIGENIHFFGQSVFGQLISSINRSDVQNLAKKHQSNRFCKGFTFWDHLLSLVFVF